MTKNAILSGATGGIGKKITYYLVNHGYNVCLLTHNVAAAEEMKKKISLNGCQCIYFPCRVENEEEIGPAFEKAQTELGPINLSFTNMGIMPSFTAYPRKKLQDTTEADWDFYYQRTFKGALNTVRYSERYLQKGGLILNCAFFGIQPEADKSLYLASRAAIKMLDDVVNVEKQDLQAYMLTAASEDEENKILSQLNHVLVK